MPYHHRGTLRATGLVFGGKVRVAQDGGITSMIPGTPTPPEYSLPFRTILGLVHKENGDINLAIEQWRIVMQADPVWLYVKDQCGPICAPIVNFWLDQAKQHLLESLPSHEVMEILAQASSEEYSVEKAERYKQKMVLIESLRMKDL